MRVGEGWRGRREEGLSSFGELIWERGRANITNDTTLSTIHVGLDFIQISSGVIVDISVLLSLVSWTFSQFFSRLATSYCNHASMTINRLWSFWTSMKKLDIRHVMMKVAAPAMKKIRWTHFVASPLECRYAAWRILVTFHAKHGSSRCIHVAMIWANKWYAQKARLANIKVCSAYG